jgi:hypothetical protein
MVDNYVNRLRGNDQFFNTLPNAAIGWNEYNSSNKVNGGNGDAEEGVEPTMSTEIRMNTLLERTSVDQVQFTFNLMNRNKYRPLYEDRRLQGTDNEGTNGRYYIGTEKNTNRGATITRSFDSSDFNGEGDTNGGQRTTIEGVGEPFGEPNKFFWTTGGEQNFNPNTLLYKTQQLVNNNQDDVFINQTKKFFKDKKQDKLISRGNAISPLALIDASANGNYCRVWTVNDRYNYLRAIRNTGLFTSDKGTKGFSATENTKEKSVLLDSGFPKYHPTIEDSKSERKKFMLSLENLAWADNLADLPLSEIGPGDTLSGNKGRIMWFPPYGLTFDENVSSNWTTTEFIGRSEPVYTYNNTKRSGSLSFMILVDHPRVINGYRGKSNDLIERFMAGCVSPRDFLESLGDSVSQTDKDEIEKKLNEKKKQKLNVSSSDETVNVDEIEPKSEIKESPTGTLDPEEVKLIDNLIIDESAYFDFIDGNYPNYFKTISEKIKYFQPGFHSMTPEGLNTRLTFLQQCMRQGPSIYDRVTNKDGNETGVQPQNLSFGRPPICILRIGDFFYTKIAINSLSITYEGGTGIQWDLNPEGIGVQPMIAKVQLSIDLIGGHSLSGPINRLQNALSYNYYANTEVYDPRADKIVDGKIKDGIKLGEVKQAFAEGDERELKKALGINEEDENNNSGDEQDEGKEGLIKVSLSDIESGNPKINASTPNLPSQTQVDKNGEGANEENEMFLSFKTNSSNDSKKDDVTSLTYNFSDIPNLADQDELKVLNNDITNTEEEIESLQVDFKNTSNSQTKKEIKEEITDQKNALREYKQNLKKYLSEYDTEIKVEAYFTKSKNKTRVKQTFTISKDGIN